MKGKRLLVVLLAFVFVLTSFTACGLFGNNKKPNKNNQQGSESVTLTDKALAGDMLIDFTKGADASVVFESDGWTNGDVFNVVWAKNNVKYENGKMLLSIVKEDKNAWLDDKEVTFPYTAGEARTQNYFGYGDYTVKMKPSANPGTASTFFICTGNYDSKYVLDENGNVVYNEDGTIKSEPNRHDEIDIEFLGKDTTKVQFNFFVDGKGGNEYMYDLGFDASKEYHEYGFRWEEKSITWFIDGKPVYKVTTDKSATAGTNVRIVDELPYTPGRILMSHWCGNERAYNWMGEYAGTTKDNGCEYEWIKSTTKGAPLNPEITTPGGDENAENPDNQNNPGTTVVPEIDWSKISAIKPTFGSTDVYTVTTNDTTSNIKYSAVGGSSYINVEMDITEAAKNTNTLHLTLKNNASTDVQVRVNVIDAELLAKGAQNSSTNKIATMNGATIFTDLEWGGSFFDIKAGETVDAVICFTGVVERLQLMIDSSRNDSETRSGDVTVSDIKFNKEGEIVDENTVVGDAGDGTPAVEYKINPLEKVMKVIKAVNVRDLPKKIGEKIGVLSKDQIVLVTGQCKQTKWYRIVYKDGQVGYVTPEYLKDAAPEEQPAPTSTKSIFISGREYTFNQNDYTVKSNKNNELRVTYKDILGAEYGNISAGLTGISTDYNKFAFKVTNNGKATVKLRVDIEGSIETGKNPDGGAVKASNLYATQDGKEARTDYDYGGTFFEIAAGKTSTIEIYFDASKKAETLLVFIDSSDWEEKGKNIKHSGDITLKAMTFSKATVPSKPEDTTAKVDKSLVINGKEITFNNNEYTISANDTDKTLNVKYEGIKGGSYSNVSATISAIDRAFNTFTFKVKNNGSKEVSLRADVANSGWTAANTAATKDGAANASATEFKIAAGATSTIVITYDASKDVVNLVFYIDSYGSETTSGDITFSEMAFSKVESTTPPEEDTTANKLKVNWLGTGLSGNVVSGDVVDSFKLTYTGVGANTSACANFLVANANDVAGKDTFTILIKNNNTDWGSSSNVRVDVLDKEGQKIQVEYIVTNAWYHQPEGNGVMVQVGGNQTTALKVRYDSAKTPAQIMIYPAISAGEAITSDLTFSGFEYTKEGESKAVNFWTGSSDYTLSPQTTEQSPAKEVNITFDFAGNADGNWNPCGTWVGNYLNGNNTFVVKIKNNDTENAAKLRVDIQSNDGAENHICNINTVAYGSVQEVKTDVGSYITIEKGKDVILVITYEVGGEKGDGTNVLFTFAPGEKAATEMDITVSEFKFFTK